MTRPRSHLLKVLSSRGLGRRRAQARAKAGKKARAFRNNVMKAPHPQRGAGTRDSCKSQDQGPRGYPEPCPPGLLRWVRRAT